MIVVITSEAETDLEQIGDRIATDNPLRAVSFVRELREKCETLSDAPRGYALVPRREHLGIRRRPRSDYLIGIMCFINYRSKVEPIGSLLGKIFLFVSREGSRF
jgi:toxin ParE1/3/4